MKRTPQLRARLSAAAHDLETRAGISPAGWSDDQCILALSLLLAGHSAGDTAAIVRGDAVVEDGVVDHNPGCAWIDMVLHRCAPTNAACERILADWDARRDTIIATVSIASTPQRTSRSLHLVF